MNNLIRIRNLIFRDRQHFTAQEWLERMRELKIGTNDGLQTKLPKEETAFRIGGGVESASPSLSPRKF